MHFVLYSCTGRLDGALTWLGCKPVKPLLTLAPGITGLSAALRSGGGAGGLGQGAVATTGTGAAAPLRTFFFNCVRALGACLQRLES